MDAVIAIADFLTTQDVDLRRTIAERLQDWYSMGCARPEIGLVRAEIAKRGCKWTTHREALAIFGGAIPASVMHANG